MRMFKCKSLLYLSLLIIALATIVCSACTVFAQNETKLQDSLKIKLSWYKQIHPSTTLFAHFDKTIYTNNENVWFTAYLLNAVNFNQHSILAVSLVNDIDHSVILGQKFVISNGIGFGNLFLPDSIAAGNYTFILCTNRLINKKPEAVFMQPITVKNTNTSDFKATLAIADSSKYDNTKPQIATLSVIGNNYLPIVNAAVNYQITGKNGATFSGKAKTDKAGNYSITLPPDKNLVKVQVQYNKSSKYLYLRLPEKQKQIQVAFYPEGGGLVDRLVSIIGWEVKTYTGLPLKVTGILLKDNVPVDTLTTDMYGIGKFVMKPQAGSKYIVKLLNQPDTIYHLPVARISGLVLTIGKSIANDSVKLCLQSSYDTNVFLNVHNYREQFFTKMVRLKAAQPRMVIVDLTELPKGLTEITLSDSIGHPYAERLFFAHYDRRDLLTLKTEKQQYHTREKVYLKLKLQGADTNKIKGLVSVACVQDNRLEIKKLTDIESYFYLKHDLGDLPLKESYLDNNSADRIFLENILLIKGWRKYVWPELLQTKAQDTINIASFTAFSGNISDGNKPIKKETFVVVANDSSSHIINTTAHGNFELPNNYFVTEQDRKVKFLINGALYKLNLIDPFTAIYTTLAQQFKPKNFELPSYSQNSEALNMKGFERAIQLKAITILAKKDNSLYSTTNACGDYVCRYNVLNCPNHRNEMDNRPPILGERYKVNDMVETYSGCAISKEKFNYAIAGIYRSKQFYGADYSEVNDLTPDYVSTIYWKHLVELDSAKETELSFYTSDITGKFRIVVQGVTSDDVVHSETSFNVLKP